MTLSTEQIDALENILFSDALSEDSLDYYGVHGLICASEVGPSPIEANALVRLILGKSEGESDPAHSKALLPFIEAISLSVREDLKDELEPELPFSEDESHLEDAIESWCCGFMEGFFENEADWVSDNDEAIANLMLPIMAWSHMFDSDDFQELYDNETLMQTFSENLGEVLIDLFLLLNAQ